MRGVRRGAKAIAEAKDGFEAEVLRDPYAWRPQMKTRDPARLRLAAARYLFARYPFAEQLEQVWVDRSGLERYEICPAQAPLGEDNLFIVSVGTGSYRLRSDGRGISAEQAVTALSGVIGDGEALTLTLLQWLSASSNPWSINSEIGDLSGDYLGHRQGLAKPLLRFQRYDAPLEAHWLKEHLNRTFSKTELDSLRDFTNPRNVNKLYQIGSEAARKQVQAEHLPHDFTVETLAT